MSSLSSSIGLLNDAVVAANLAFKSSSRDLFRTWILVPLGIVIMLYFVLALNSLIGLGSVDFPASVACLLILFFFLLGASFVLPQKTMDIVLKVLDVPIGFALRTMNLYFTPSFILLPLSTSISGKEVGVLIGVFVIGYVVQYALTAYTCRALQLSLGKIRKSKNHVPEDVENHEITESGERRSEQARSQTNDTEKVSENPPLTTSDGAGHESSPNSWNTVQSSATTTPSPTLHGSNSFICENASPTITRPEKWAASIKKHLDIGIYVCLFIFIGIPVYYATGYTMPIFLTLNVLVFFAANMIPPNIKRIAHPVLVTALFTVFGIWILALTESKTLDDGLDLYETGTKYLEYFRGTKNLPRPGAGDILASLLDASIVALAMPMYQYRKDLQKFFVAIFIPALVLALPSLFGYPPLCYALGVSSTISLAMAPRSVTLALAQLSTSNLGGASSAISPIAVVSGISGPIFGPTILHFLRISEEDYVTTGVVLGANSSAIATAMLLKKDRRAAALSALSMSIFGLLFVILTAIPEVVAYVRNLVGL